MRWKFRETNRFKVTGEAEAAAADGSALEEQQADTEAPTTEEVPAEDQAAVEVSLQLTFLVDPSHTSYFIIGQGRSRTRRGNR